MARVTRVKKCRKAQGNCGRCGDPINKGDPYLHFSPGFRARKRVRCTKPGCAPRPSDLTANDRLSRVYGAQETAEDTIEAWDGEDVEDLKSALEAAADEIREVAEEYQESADAMNETAEGSPWAEECEEKAQELESWVDDFDSADLEEWDKETHPDKDDWVEACKEEARSKLSECPV